MAYIRSAQSGNFSAASTWVGGVVPTTGDIACTLAHRIVLDVDTNASLSVSRTDWVAGGGTDSATITGGFTLPTDAVRVIGGDIRYDNGTTSARNTSTTSPVYMTSGTLTVRSLVWVSGTNAIVSGTPAFYVVNIATVSDKTSKFTYTDTATVLYTTSSTLGTFNTYSVYVSGPGFADLTFGEAVQVQATAGASSNCSMLLLLSHTGGYSLTLNGNVPTGASLSNTGVIQISATPTGLDNQKLIINSSVLGRCPVVSVNAREAVYINGDGVSSIQVKSTKLDLYGYGSHVITLGSNGCAFGFTANEVEFYYDKGLNITSSGSVAVTKIYINAATAVYSTTACIFSGSGNVTIGSILLRAITSVLVSARSVKAVSLSGTGNITVGDISSESGQLSEIGLLSISNASALTTQISIGNINCANNYVRAASSYNYPIPTSATSVVYIARRTTGTITVGSITGSDNGLIIASDLYALRLEGFATDNGAVTINGNVSAGNRMGGVFINSTAKTVNINGSVRGVTAILGTSFNTPLAVATIGVVTCNRIDASVDNITTVFGRYFFNSYTNGILQLEDSANNLYDLYTVAQTNQVIPQASDVRSGVLVGSTTGTLAVPPASTVLQGVPVGATVGSLSLSTDLATITSKLDSIENQTDKLTFTTTTTEIPDPNNDPYWSSVVLASHCDSLTVIDEKAHTFTNSNVTLSTTISKFGGSSFFFSGSSSGLSSTSADYLLGTSDFTIEFWFYQGSSSNIYQRLLQIGADSTAGGLWIVANQANTTTTTPFVDGYTTTWTRLADAVVTLARNTWHHLAVTRSGNTFNMYLNGVLAAYSTYSYNITGTTLYIGHSGNYSEAFNGYIDDIRITRGVARYTANFTPPTSAFPGYSTVTVNGVSSVVALASVDMTDITPRFNTIDASLATANTGITAANNAAASVKAKTDQLTFGAGGVIAQTSSTDYTARFDTLEAQVSSIPTLTYTTSFAGINTKLDALATATADVDFTPVLDAIAAIPAPNLTPITTKIDNMQADVTTIKDAAVRIEALSSGIRDELSTATGVDLSGVEHQLSLLNSKFDGVDAPVQVVPTGDADTTVLYAHCTRPDGTPVAGQSATLHIMQVLGEGTLLPDHTLTSTSGADGLISFVLPRGAGISAMFEYRGRKERVVLVGEATQALPSIVAKL